jgi:hypothetical protein
MPECDLARIALGIYMDCATWQSHGLTIEAAAAGALLDGKPCPAERIYFMTGSDITVHNLTFEHFPTYGVNLTAERSRFIPNE